MDSSQTAPEVFDIVYLEIRARLLEVAASLDRIDRSEDAEAVQGDRRRELIQQGLEIIISPGLNRAEQVQVLFSDPYEAGWNAPAATE